MVGNQLFFHLSNPQAPGLLRLRSTKFTESRTKYLQRVHQGEPVSEIGISPILARAGQRWIYPVVRNEHEFWDAPERVIWQ
jgi:hypothetical protein